MARFLIVFIALMVSIHTTMGGIARTKRSFVHIECPLKSCDGECQYMDMECRCHAVPSEYCRIKNAIPPKPPMPPTTPPMPPTTPPMPTTQQMAVDDERFLLPPIKNAIPPKPPMPPTTQQRLIDERFLLPSTNNAIPPPPMPPTTPPMRTTQQMAVDDERF